MRELHDGSEAEQAQDVPLVLRGGARRQPCRGPVRARAPRDPPGGKADEVQALPERGGAQAEAERANEGGDGEAGGGRADKALQSSPTEAHLREIENERLERKAFGRALGRHRSPVEAEAQGVPVKHRVHRRPAEC